MLLEEPPRQSVQSPGSSRRGLAKIRNRRFPPLAPPAKAYCSFFCLWSFGNVIEGERVTSPLHPSKALRWPHKLLLAHTQHSLTRHVRICRGTRLVVHSMTPTASANIHRSSHRPRCVSDTRQPIDECFEVWPVNHHDWQCVGRKNFVQQWIDQG